MFFQLQISIFETLCRGYFSIMLSFQGFFFCVCVCVCVCLLIINSGGLKWVPV